ncbi:MAG: Inner membrane protein YrbG [Alphaproteobacteria bacterium MarineAlpha9_Bin5]|nr:MAG: Inner membrane protein YrbG [Alphaproteobacteria bacterium MarineAlpha9_Bin5]
MLVNMPVMALLLVAAGGLAILLTSGNVMIRGAISLARCLGVSPLMIGMSVVAFGTSAPELVVSIQALWKEAPDIVLGNVVGSNVANILLIVGVAATIKTLVVPGGAKLRKDCMYLLVFTAIFVVLCWLGEIPGLLGALMVVGLVSYIIWSFRRSRKDEQLSAANSEPAEELEEKPLSLGKAVLYTAFGIGGIVLGAYVLLEGSVQLAREFGVSDVVIGLTIIAIGTSLPELAASVMAAIRGHPGLAIGNVMGSNLFNMFGITGISAAISEMSMGALLQVPAQMVRFDLWVMFGSTMLICVILLRGWRIARLGGLAMMALYALYITVLF